MSPAHRHVHQPASPWVEQGPPLDGRIPRVHLEYTSCGDRVTGVLLRPEAGHAAELLLVLLCFDVAGPESRAAALARDACTQGVAVFAPDLPLCGARRSAKLSEQLTLPPEYTLPAPERERLLDAAVSQAVADVEAGVEVVTARTPGPNPPVALLAEGPLAGRLAARLVASGRVPIASSLAREPGADEPGWETLRVASQTR